MTGQVAGRKVGWIVSIYESTTKQKISKQAIYSLFSIPTEDSLI